MLHSLLEKQNETLQLPKYMVHKCQVIQRGSETFENLLFLWFPVCPATDSKALGIHSARSRFVFVFTKKLEKNIPPSFIKHDHGRIARTDLSKTAKTQKTCLLFHLQLLQLQVHVVVLLCLTKKQKMELDSLAVLFLRMRGGQCWSCCFDQRTLHKSLLGRTRTNILKWHHFAFHG